MKNSNLFMKKITPLSLIIFGILTMLVGTTSAQESLTLERALEIAYRNSPTLIQNKISLERDKNSLVIQQSGLKSQFQLGLDPFSYSRSSTFEKISSEWNSYKTMSAGGDFSIRQPLKWTDGTLTLSDNFSWQESSNQSSGSTNTSFSNKVQLRLDQPIFTYNKTKMDLKKQEYTLEKSKINYAIQQLEIEKNVTNGFYQVYQSFKSLATAREEFQNQKQNYEIIKNKVEAGLIPKEELFQAEVNFAKSEISLSDQETSYENTKDQFKQTLGLPLDEDLMVIPDIKVDPVDIDIDINLAVKYALEQRMELRQRQIDIENGLFELIVAKSTNEFKGNISATVGLFGNDNKANGAFQNLQDNEDVSVSLTIPLWDWGVRKSTIRNAQLSNESTKIDYEEQKKTIVIQIRQLCRELPKLVKQIKIAKQNLNNAELTYDINMEKYRNGTISGMDLQNYQNQLSSAKNELTNSTISYKLRLLDLKIQTLWDFKTNHSFLPVDLLK